MLRQLRLVILVSIGFFCLDNINYTPPPPEPVEVVIEVADTYRADLTERRIWLIRESIAYALHEVADIPGDQAREIVCLVDREALQYESVDRIMVLGLIVAESMANDKAISSAGARGIMQIMPPTGRFIANRLDEKWEGQKSLHETEKNIRYGVWYLNHLSELFPNDKHAMVAAYNWGPPNIQNRLNNGHTLPRVYPGKVREAEQRIRRKMYEFHKEQYWRSLDLSRDPPYFDHDSSESPGRSRHPECPGDDGEGEFLRAGRGVQQMSNLLPGGD